MARMRKLTFTMISYDYRDFQMAKDWLKKIILYNFRKIGSIYDY